MKDIHNYFFGQIPEMPWKEKNKMELTLQSAIRIILDYIEEISNSNIDLSDCDWIRWDELDNALSRLQEELNVK